LAKRTWFADALAPVHTTLEKFENGVLILKMHQTFSVYTTPEKFENGVFTLNESNLFPSTLRHGI